MPEFKIKNRCPICEKTETVDKYDKPITYWCCRACKSVFVRDDDGLIGVLNLAVEYNFTVD